MKRFIAISLLLGYIMLVPFCFFGGALMADMSAMDMSGSPMLSMNDCGMSVAGCAGSTDTGAMGMIAHHVGMYLSITQTPLVALLAITMMVVSLFLVTFVVTRQLIGELYTSSPLRFNRRVFDKPRNLSKQRLLTWLSLFETSPNFA